MAKEEKKEAAHHEEAAQDGKKSNKLLIIIIAVILVLILAVAVTIVMVLKGDSHAKEDQQHTSAAPVEHQAEQTPQAQKPKPAALSEETRKFKEIGVLFPLDTFTVNLKSDAGKRYLKSTISLELEGKELGKELTSKIAVIRDRIIKILSSKTVEEISSQKGKQKVTEQIMETLNAMITDGSIKGVYFTEFVIQ